MYLLSVYSLLQMFFSCCRKQTAVIDTTTAPPSPVRTIAGPPSPVHETPPPLDEPVDEKLFIDLFDYSSITYKDTVPWVPPITQGKVIKVYDGDTITIASRFYENSPIWRFSVRLRGIDTPEMKGGDLFERIKAKEAQSALERLIFGKIIQLRNVATEKYGRVLADVYLDDLHVNQYMLDKGYAVPYDGGKKKEWNLTAAD